ncbi:hypothetical protein [Brevundimonas sp.]|uniref:hypothetical protein n=1 Tax=Brevundimonas sp. TaxID=1871086 RepID=UPI0035186964
MWTVGHDLVVSLVPATLDVPATDAPESFSDQVAGRSLAYILLVFALAPAMIESVAFVLIYLFVRRLSRFGFANMVVYVALIWLFGFVAHGADLQQVGKATAFAGLAALFWRARTDVGLPSSYALVSLAHFVWNASSVLIWYARQ